MTQFSSSLCLYIFVSAT